MSGNFDWPWEYKFPPFFTLQPNERTQQQQLNVWTNLVQRYQKYKNETELDLNEDSELFHNSEIKRTLPIEVRVVVLERLQSQGHAAPAETSSKRSARQTLWQVYWHTLDEWSKMIYDWAVSTGQTNTVCTIYEISNGDAANGQEFHQLNESVILKALKILETKGKCELMIYDEHQGVKFF